MSTLGFSLAARPQLTASPHMQQAVRLLQLSAVDFTQELAQALSTNPFLEEVEEIDADLDGETDEVRDAISEAGDDLETLDLPQDQIEVSERFEQLESGADESPELHTEQREAFESMSMPSGSRTQDAWDFVRSHSTLREHLLEQISGARLSPREQIAAALVIETLDEEGYLRDEVSGTAQAAGVDLHDDEIAQAIAFVQQCDPPGVAARSLGECLALQIDALETDTDPATRLLARAVAQDHLELLAQRRYANLRQLLHCDDEALNAACALVRSLDPRPGLTLCSPRTEYVVPDVLVRFRGRELVTLINPASRPGARLNSTYAQWFKTARAPEHGAMAQQLQEARWLMHNVEQRYVTIQRVAEAIVKRQRAFFECGDVGLKPLVLREVAEDLGIHESTVSRATGNKFMDTPRGLFEFRHFFSRSLATETGTACSAAAVRALMTEMLAEEGSSKPLSDVALARMLGQNGVRVSRRTVTKYRNLMKVAPVELRKRA